MHKFTTIFVFVDSDLTRLDNSNKQKEYKSLRDNRAALNLTEITLRSYRNKVRRVTQEAHYTVSWLNMRQLMRRK